MNDKPYTLVLGASSDPERYSYRAIRDLRKNGHPVLAIGRQAARVDDVTIHDGPVTQENIDTVTLYLLPRHQVAYYDYLLSLHPRRIIFNPGTENPELQQRAQANGIQTLEACTLVLLHTGQY